jgi:hypothetical protein
VVRREMKGLIIYLNSSMNLNNEISLSFGVKLLLGRW